MLMPPDYILEKYKNKTYEELLRVRDRCIRKVRKFEKEGPVYKEYKAGDLVLVDLASSPSPEMEYENGLEFLGLLCKLIAEKHNETSHAKASL